MTSNSFEEMLKRASTRQEIEARIMQLADDVPLLESGWVRSREFDQFLDAWHKLELYYRTHIDSQIDVRAVGAYRDFSRLLRLAAFDTAVEESIREQALDALGFLENILMDIVADVVTNIESQ